MRKMKKFFALMLAMIMAMAMTVTAFAEEGKGTITIGNATVGQSYTAYKIFDANPTSSEGGSIAYTATETQMKWFTGKEGNPFTFTESIVKGTDGKALYNVEKAEGKNDADVIAFLKGLYTTTGEGDNAQTTLDAGFEAIVSKVDPVTATTSTVTMNVPYGYYLVISSLGATITVDSTNPNATIIDKNQSGPSWPEEGGKKIVSVNGENLTSEATENSANYGDVVGFKVTLDTTNYDGDQIITRYIITDQIDNGMTYDKVGNIVKATIKVGDTVLLNKNNFDETKAAELITMDQDGQGFTINIPWTKEDGTSEYNLGSQITVEYSATVTSNATIAGEGNKNTAGYNYIKGDGTSPSPTPSTSETTTYTYALAIKKVDEKGKALQGAQFTVKKADGSAINVTPTSVDGVYEYAKTGGKSTVTSNVYIS